MLWWTPGHPRSDIFSGRHGDISLAEDGVDVRLKLEIFIFFLKSLWNIIQNVEIVRQGKGLNVNLGLIHLQHLEWVSEWTKSDCNRTRIILQGWTECNGSRSGRIGHPSSHFSSTSWSDASSMCDSSEEYDDPNSVLFSMEDGDVPIEGLHSDSGVWSVLRVFVRRFWNQTFICNQSIMG